MKTNTSRLIGIAELSACVALAGLCISLAVAGQPIAVLFGIGSLSFAADFWRRIGRSKPKPNSPEQPRH